MSQLGTSIFRKKIKDGWYLKITPWNSNLKSTGIEEYLFPDVSIEINGDDYYCFSVPDLRSLVFLPGTTFTFFYIESHSMDKNGDVITNVVRKRDEPVIYENKAASKFKYTTSNSYDKLELYNKYIYLSLELYCHYFRLFEKFIHDSVLSNKIFSV